MDTTHKPRPMPPPFRRQRPSNLRPAATGTPPVALSTPELAAMAVSAAHPQPIAPSDEITERYGDTPRNQGEGDRISARVYEQRVHEFIASGDVGPAARDAARAVDGPEAGELRAAEAAGKQPARSTLVDRIKGAVRRVVDTVTRRGH